MITNQEQEALNPLIIRIIEYEICNERQKASNLFNIILNIFCNEEDEIEFQKQVDTARNAKLFI